MDGFVEGLRSAALSPAATKTLKKQFEGNYQEKLVAMKTALTPVVENLKTEVTRIENMHAATEPGAPSAGKVAKRRKVGT